VGVWWRARTGFPIARIKSDEQADRSSGALKDQGSCEAQCLELNGRPRKLGKRQRESTGLWLFARILGASTSFSRFK
jgi:hypothetical protein